MNPSDIKIVCESLIEVYPDIIISESSDIVWICRFCKTKINDEQGTWENLLHKWDCPVKIAEQLLKEIENGRC